MGAAVKYNPDEAYTISDQVAHREIEGQILILRPGDNHLYTLNGSGKHIWLEIKKKKTLSQMIKSLTRKFGISEEDAAKDVLGFISDMTGKDILVKKGRK